MKVAMQKTKIPRRIFRNRNAFLLQQCKGKHVLHIGATDWPYTQQRLHNTKAPLLYQQIDGVCASQLGIDIDKEGAEFLNMHMPSEKSRIEIMDMNHLGTIDYTPDVIIFGEVIEHLMNIETALTHIKQVMNEKTKLVITTPNAYHWKSLLLNVLGYEVFHPDHKLIFTYAILKNILSYNGLKEETFYFTKLNVRGEEMNVWSRLLAPFGELTGMLFPQFYNNLMFVCTLHKD